MPPQKKATTNVRDVRRLLLDEAIRVIESSGEHSLRTRAIADAVGVTEPALFHHFANREALIEEAQVERNRVLQVELIERFRYAVLMCTSKKEFIEIIEFILDAISDISRAPARATRINVAGSAVTRPRLMKRFSDEQNKSNTGFSDALLYAQRRGWIRADLNLESFAVWLNGVVTGRFFAEIQPENDYFADWDDYTRRSVFLLLGLPVPASRSTPKKTTPKKSVKPTTRNAVAKKSAAKKPVAKKKQPPKSA